MALDEDKAVRASGLSCVANYVLVLGGEHMAPFLPGLQQTIASPKWRVRVSGLDCLFRIAASVRNIDMVVTQLDPLMLQGLSDKVYEVRSQCVDHVGKVAQVYRQHWLDHNLLPLLTSQFATSPSHLRITVL